jgi:tight adherence protein B
MAPWIATALGLSAALAALCLLAAMGREFVRRRTIQQRMATFLLPPVEPGGAADTANSPKVWQSLLGLGVSSGSVLLIATGTVVALVSLLVGWTPGLVLATAALAVGGVLALRRGSRRDHIEQQLAAVLQTMASALESGYSVQQTIERVVRDAPDPIADEFAQVLRAIELGTSLEVALAQLAERVGGDTFEFFATVTAMQYRIGGDLPTLLTSLAMRIQERLELKAEMQALTAQARYSGWVLTALPFAVVAMLLIASPGYLAPLVWTPTGRNLVLFAATLLVAGLASIRTISRVEV